MNRILFYSEKCQTSNKLIIFMKNLNILSSFQMISIEQLQKNNKPIPGSITKVPAICLPELNSILEGRHAFEWIENIRVNIIKMNMTKNMNQMGPLGFTNQEMNGVSDNFAYTEGPDMAQPKNFLPYGKDDDYAIYTGNELNKLGKKDFDKQIINIKKEREEYDKTKKDIYEKTLENTIYNFEKQKILEEFNK